MDIIITKTKEVFMFLILTWSAITASLGRVVALLVGGFFVGFAQGMQDLRGFAKYFRYRIEMMRKRTEKEQDKG
jgi:hypothetical protein